jgi:hypothetical protein
VLLLNVVSLMVGSTAGAAMSPWYGGNRTAMPPPSCTTYATTSSCTEVFKYYTTKALEFYTETYAAPSHYTEGPKYYSAPSYYTIQAMECYMTTYAAHPTTPRLLNITLFSATYCTDVPKYYSVPRCYTKAPADYSTTTEAAKVDAVQTSTPKLLFRATLNRNTTLMLQSTSP